MSGDVIGAIIIAICFVVIIGVGLYVTDDDDIDNAGF